MKDLKKIYVEEILPGLVDKHGYKSVMQAPKLVKITLNMGVGEAAQDKKAIQGALDDLTRISGQKPIVCSAKKSVAGFKIRQGWPIGCKVTLRNKRMYQFLHRLIAIVIPRVRDFRGLKASSFDGRGNYSFGFHEQIVFPEINYDKIDKLRGLDVCITTTATSNEEGRSLLEGFNFPLKKV